MMTFYRRGVTLIEMLVGMTILSIALAMISGFFIVQSRAGRMQKAMNEANDAGRTALSLISWDLQNAGYKVVTSTQNPALIINPTTNSGIKDIVTIRYYDESLGKAQRVHYSIQDSSRSVHRGQFDDNPNIAQNIGPTVASVVAMNVRFETRENQYITPVGTPPGCAAGQTPIRNDAGTTVINCGVNWEFSDVPKRLVRSIRLQILARSELRVSGAFKETTTFTFDGGATYTTEPGYAYLFVEQTVVSPNLGR
jgi:prepilin-type N-terminal cleavage/methylation domain-containing protein